jgi:hypothetical protein
MLGSNRIAWILLGWKENGSGKAIKSNKTKKDCTISSAIFQANFKLQHENEISIDWGVEFNTQLSFLFCNSASGIALTPRNKSNSVDRSCLQNGQDNHTKFERQNQDKARILLHGAPQQTINRIFVSMAFDVRNNLWSINTFF